MPTLPDDHFVLHQIRWTRPGSPLFAPGESRRLPASFPVAALPDAEAAAAARRQMDDAARRLASPFLWGGPALFYLTSLDAAGLVRRLREAGIKKLPKIGDRYTAWRSWDNHDYAALTEEQRLAVWDAMDKVRFAEVHAAPVASAFVVQKIAWKMGEGEPLESDCEGGHGHRVFRSREPAEEWLRELDAKLRQQEKSFHKEMRHDFQRRVGTQPEDLPPEGEETAGWYSYQLARLWGPLAPGGRFEVMDVPFAELVEIPVWGEPVGPAAYLLERRALDPEGSFCTDGNGEFTEGRVPLGLYADRQQAEAGCAQLEQAARQYVSPFAFPYANERGDQGDWLWAASTQTYTSFRQEIEALGLRPPPLEFGNTSAVSPSGHCVYHSPHWLKWWDAHVDAMTDTQRQRIWAMLDHIRFCRVTEVRVEPG